MKGNQTLLTFSDLTSLTGVCFRTLKKRMKDVKPAKIDNKSFYFESMIALPAIYKEERESLDPSMVKVELDKEELRLTRAKADKVELEVGSIRKNLLPADLVEKLISEVVLSFRSSMLGLPSKAALSVKHAQSSEEIELLLRNNVHEALDELSNELKRCHSKLFMDEDGEDNEEGSDPFSGTASVYGESVGR
jgi:phage terminase Nu1 subunit (DNA packaging protein)